MKMELIPAVAKALEELRRQRPLIHHITNFVTMTDCANATLAIGASPLPIRLSLLNPAIVNRLLEMQKTLQRSELS